MRDIGKLFESYWRDIGDLFESYLRVIWELLESCLKDVVMFPPVRQLTCLLQLLPSLQTPCCPQVQAQTVRSFGLGATTLLQTAAVG